LLYNINKKNAVVINYLKFYFLAIVPKNLYFFLEYIIEVIIIFHAIVYIKLHDIDNKLIVRSIMYFNRSSSGPPIRNYRFRSSILLLLLLE
jgi:hypothetical protein